MNKWLLISWLVALMVFIVTRAIERVRQEGT